MSLSNVKSSPSSLKSMSYAFRIPPAHNFHSRPSASVCKTWHAGAFAPEQYDVLRRESVIEVGALGRGREQDETQGLFPPPIVEGGERGVADDVDLVEIVHAGAAERPVGDRETGRLDDVRLDSEARAQPQDGTGVLGNIRLVEGDPHRCRPVMKTALAGRSKGMSANDLCNPAALAR